MAVTGRQSLHANFMSQHTTAASASAMFNNAKSRAFSCTDNPDVRAALCAIRFQWPGGVTVPGPSAQKYAISVCSGVRTVLLRAPSVLTSSKSCAYSGLSIFGGHAGRNCDPDVIPNG